MDALARLLRTSFRRLRARPGFTVVAALSLALGIGANTAMFSVVDAVLLRGQPYTDPGSLVDIYIDGKSFAYEPLSYPDFLDVRRVTEDLLAGVTGAGYTLAQADLAGGGVEMIAGELVPSNYFRLLGIEPALGRGFEDGEDAAEGAAPVVVLSWERWTRAHGGDRSIIGRAIRLSGRSYTVVGVAPQGYHGAVRGLAPDFWAPITMDAAFSPEDQGRLDTRTAHWFFVRGRLRDGIERAALDARLAGLAAELRHDEPGTWDTANGFRTVPTARVVVNPMIDRFLYAGGAVLMALVALVLTITCANLASFLLARAADQRKEVAIRSALGATRGQLVAQQMTDAGILALVGGGAGAGAAALLVSALGSRPLPVGIPIRLEASVDVRMLVFGFAVTLLSALLFGLAPALQSTRVQAAPVLKDEGTGGGSKKQRLRSALVLGQVALSTMLLVAAGLFLRSLGAMQHVDPGFGAEPTAILNFAIPSSHADPGQRRVFLDELLAEVRAMPEVEAVGLIDNLHLNITNTQFVRFNVDGVEPPADAEAHLADYAWADGGFFEAAGVRIVQGRAFHHRDRQTFAPGERDKATVAIVSQAFVDRFFPDRPAIGQRLRRPGKGDVEIVGVAADTMVRLLGEDPRPFVYLDAEQVDVFSTTLVARTRGDAKALAARILAGARSLGPELMVLESRTVEDHLATQLLPSRALAAAFALFGSLALAIAAIGLYGTVSFTVAARAREIGIRMSLGASGPSVVRLLARGGAALVLLGGAMGLILALVVTRVAGSLLFRVETQDPLVFLAVPALLLLVAGLATVLPTLRALRVSPSSTLRAT
ncbi:MAG TPA: ABC transporter permease [Thermoanaerobaculia bacterium]|nr:ABC transporter permease [Thermoanaerobaculia bacterium]